MALQQQLIFFDVAAKGTLPLSDIFSLYGQNGLGYGMNGWSGNSKLLSDLLIMRYKCELQLWSALVGFRVSFQLLDKHFDLRRRYRIHTIQQYIYR